MASQVPAADVRTLHHVRRLVEREIALREQGRAIELDPRRRDEATELFRQAGRLARRRLAIARGLGLW